MLRQAAHNLRRRARHLSAAPVCTPTVESVQNSRLAAFADATMGGGGAYDLARYEALHAWSVREPRAFWRAVFGFLELPGDLGDAAGDAAGPAPWAPPGSPPGAVDWFPGAAVNHAELLLEGPSKPADAVALISHTELGGEGAAVTFGELRQRVATVQAALASDGVGPGDRVAGVVANDAGAAVAMLAATSLGASWSSVSPDFGEKGCLDRLAQVKPKVLFVSDRYSYRGKVHDILGKVASFSSLDTALDSVERCVVLPYGDVGGVENDMLALPAWWNVVPAESYVAESNRSVSYARGGFDVPSYVMFSSGTTGAPKCIVQGPGVALNHAKEGALHMDVRAGERVLWYTTTGWMMWNWLLGAALTNGAGAVLWDSDATYSGFSQSKATDALFEVADRAGVHVLGGSARYYGACAAEEIDLPDLKNLKGVGSTGSPCPPSAYAWLEKAKPGVPLYSTSGGTDLNGSFNTGNPWLPVYSGELACAGLGLDVAILDDDGAAAVPAGAQGELSCKSAFPCAPLKFLGDDAAGSKYRSSYFDDDFAGGTIWKHGDWAEPTAAGGVVIHGRSDATLNPGGVRIGTAEIYNAIEPLLKDSAALEDSLVSAEPFVFSRAGSEVADVRVVLFLQTADADAAAALAAAAAAAAADPSDANVAALLAAATVDAAVVRDLKKIIRERGSPRHVPAIVALAPDIPKTNNGKKVEMAVMNALKGKAVSNRGSIANAACIDFYEAIKPHLAKMLPEGA